MPTIQLNEKLKFHIADDYQKVKLPYFDEWMAALEDETIPTINGKLCVLNEKEEIIGECALGAYCRAAGMKPMIYKSWKDPFSRFIGRYSSGPSGSIYLPYTHPAYDIIGTEGRLLNNEVTEPLFEYKMTHDVIHTAEYFAHYVKAKIDDDNFSKRKLETTVMTLNDNFKLKKPEVAKVLRLLFC